jgi:hypothetical protein
MTTESERRELAGLLASFANREVSSSRDIEAWSRDAHSLQRRIETEFADLEPSLSDDEWRWVRHFLDDPDIRMKEPNSAYSQMQIDRFRQVISKLESA